jgi:capsular polysaccharide export protein
MALRRVPRQGRRSFLFLQGPISPYFQEVAAGLKARGHDIHRINLSLGDQLFWRGLPAIHYRGTRQAWPGFIEEFLRRHGITDVVLLGEQRDYHRVAIAAAQTLDITVAVTDFGYFRPDWITLERDAMAGGSHFPRDPAAILRLAEGVPPADLTPRLADSFPRQAVQDVLYHLAMLMPWPYPHYRTHQLHNPLAAYAGTLRRLLRRGAERAEGEAALAAIGDAPFWLFAMQMETDFSIRAYSRYTTMDAPMAETLDSFARAAPVGAHILLKVHPLDPCLKRWGPRIAALARDAGLTGRVHVAHHGPLDQMLKRARGTVTVNSTVGLRAVELGRPVKALGRAVWDVPGLAHQGPLDAFWQEGAAPEPVLRAAFLAALQATTQLRGVFYAPEGRRQAVEATVARLDADLIGP